MTQQKAPPGQSEHERVVTDEKHKAMDDLREQAHENGTDEDRDQCGGPGQWPGKELTRNVVPNPDDGEIDDEARKLPDDIQRDISQDGVTDDPSKRVEQAP